MSAQADSEAGGAPTKEKEVSRDASQKEVASRKAPILKKERVADENQKEVAQDQVSINPSS